MCDRVCLILRYICFALVGGGLTLSLMCPCGGGHPWNEEEGVVVMNISQPCYFLRAFKHKCAPNAQMQISSASGTSITDQHQDHDQTYRQRESNLTNKTWSIFTWIKKNT